MLYFNAGPISYSLNGDVPAEVSKEVREYITEVQESDHLISAQLCAVDELDLPTEGFVYETPYYVIFRKEEQEIRVFLSKYDGHPWAVYQSGNDDCITLTYLKNDFTVMDMTFMELFSIERDLIKEKAFIIHSCFVRHENDALIFTAPSGTGKSTQGNLWTQYAGAEVINGDRTILQVKDGQCIAHGLPFCGSSTINKKRSYPVKGIIYLGQAPEDIIVRRMSMDLLRMMMAQTTVNVWNREAITVIMECYESIFNKNLVLFYACTPTERAVQVLKEELYKE